MGGKGFTPVNPSTPAHRELAVVHVHCARLGEDYALANRKPTPRRVASIAVTLLALPGVVHGCSSPTAPPQPPGGGAALVLSFEQYEQNVAPILSVHGCDAGGDCHGAGIRGSLQLSPIGAKDPQFDFEQVSLQVSATDRTQSPILTEPLALAAGGTPHQMKPFADTSDPEYQAILAWILAGVEQ